MPWPDSLTNRSGLDVLAMMLQAGMMAHASKVSKKLQFFHSKPKTINLEL
jgi:hypothetical protein